MDKKDTISFIVFVAILIVFYLTLTTLAELPEEDKILSEETNMVLDTERQAESFNFDNSATVDPCFLPQVTCLDPSDDVSVGDKNSQDTGVIKEVSAYTSRVQETDETPCIPAANFNFCEVGPSEYGADYYVASNAYPLYTELEIEHLGTAIVVDRMNSRYSNRIDVYMGYDLERAVNFGVQNLSVKEI